MTKVHHQKSRYHRLSLPMLLAICALLALLWVLSLGVGATALAAPDRSQASVDAAPVAADDAYTTTGYAPLNIPAPGVLANDSDPDGDPLTATLESGPGSGSLVLNSDGSFLYQATPGFVGTDTFTYLVADGDAPAQAYWPFEEGSGTTTADMTGNGYDGTLVNGPLFTTTVPITPTFTNNYALEFDGLDDYVDVPIDVSEIAYAISLWVNTACPDCGIYSVDDGLLGGGGSDRHLYLNGGDVCARVWSNEVVCTSGTNVADGNWHHLAHTFGGAIGGQQIYIDGQLQISGTKTSSDFDWQTGINIGFSNDADDDYLDGLIDDLRIYMVPLTQAQVADAMTSDQLALGDRATVSITVPTGTLSGEVTDSSNGDTIADATVVAAYNPSVFYTAISNISGIYSLVIPAETYTVTADAFGYQPAQFLAVSVPPGVTTTLDIPLDLANHYVVDGVVTDANTGWPLYASIDIDGYPGDPIWTDPETGYYSISLPEGITYTFNVDAWVAGYLGEDRDIGPLTGDTSEDFALDVDADTCNAPGYIQENIFYDGFESGDLIVGGWITTTTNEGRVQVSTDYAYAGNYSVLLDSAVDGAYSLAGIIKPIDLSAEPQVYINFWWREFDDENDAQDGIFLSDDSGNTWCQVFSFNNGPSSYTNMNIDLTAAATTCGMSLGIDTQILFQFYDNYSISSDGYSIDEVKLRAAEAGVCTPLPDGGLVVGNIYDGNTDLSLVGALVKNENGYTAQAAGTPLDDELDDGFYTIFSPSGSKTFTATMSSGYGLDVDIVNVVMSDTVSHDFNLPAGLLEATPTGLAVTLDLGLSTTLPLNLINDGAVDADFEFVEMNRGFTSVLLKNAAAATDIEIREKDRVFVSALLALESLYPHQEVTYWNEFETAPDGELNSVLAWGLGSPIPSGPRYRSAGTSCDGESYYIFGGSDGGGLLDEAWQFDPGSDTWTQLADLPVPLMNFQAGCIGDYIYLVGGYNLSAHTNNFQIYNIDTDSWTATTWPEVRTPMLAVYNDLLFAFGGNPGPTNAAWVFDPDTTTWSSIASMPNSASYGEAVTVGDYIYQIGGGLLNVVQRYDPGTDTWDASGPQLQDARMSALGAWYGDYIYIVSGGGSGGDYWTAWDSTEIYDPSLWPGGAWSYDDETIPSPAVGMAGACAADAIWGAGGTSGGYLDLNQYLDDGLTCNYTAPDVPWLSEDPITGTVAALGNTAVDITFDAGAVTQPGEYHATLKVRNDTPYGTFGVPVTMTVNTPAAWGKVGGTLTLLGHCDADPTTPANREILIEGSSGFTATTKTDKNGYYQWWIDPSESPLTVTVAPISDYEDGIESDVMIVTGQTTTVDFNLRLLKPCASVEPESFEKVLFLGDMLTDTLDIYNNGALSTTFEITETGTITWLSEAPLTGILDADSMAAIDIVFDSSVLAGTGMYNGELRVDSDDPVHGTILVPVDMAVVSGTPGVALSPDSTLAGQPGTLVTHTFTVTNAGDVTDIYDLAIDGYTWETNTDLPTNTSFMDPGEIFTFTVTVDIPNNPALQSAIIGSDTFTVMAASQLDGSSATATGTTQAQVTTGVSLSDDQSKSGMVGDSVSYTLQVTNTGGYTDTFNLAVSGSTWMTELSENTLTLGAGASGEFIVTVTILTGASEGEFDAATITATSTLDSGATDEAVLTTTAMEYWIHLPLISKP